MMFLDNELDGYFMTAQRHGMLTTLVGGNTHDDNRTTLEQGGTPRCTSIIIKLDNHILSASKNCGIKL